MPAHLIAEEGPLRGLLLNFEEGEEWIIGRDPDEADCVIEDSMVSRKHARVTKTPDGIFIQNLSLVNPTFLNDMEMTDRVLLKEGDRIKIGHTIFLFSEEDVPNIGEAPPKKRKKQKSPKSKAGYDDIFSDLLEPELPPEPEPVEEAASVERVAEHEEEDALFPVAAEAAKTPYDTIFEDLGAESEMPFNLLAEMPLLLKVIGGPNSGAEIGLEKGRTYLLGKDPNSCDIVFQDLSVSRNHARLTISPEGILELEDLGSKNGTMVNSAPLTERNAITSQDLIAMGTTIFLIIDREAAQETIYSPILPSFEAPKEHIETMTSTAKEEEIEDKIPAEGLSWKLQKIPPKHLVLAGSSVCIFLIVFLSFFSLFKSEKIELVQKMPHDAIPEALTKFPGVQFSYNPAGGKLFLAGHVLTGVEYQELHYNLDQIPGIVSTEETIVIDEGVSKAMNEVLSENALWRGVSVTALEPGKFILHGYVLTSEQATLLTDYMMVHFPYLDRLQNKVAIDDVLTTQIQGILLGEGLGAVTFQLSSGEVILSGRYGDTQESELKSALSMLNKLDGIRSVKNYATVSLLTDASINLTQQYKVTGSSLHDNEGYSVVVNGRILTQGSGLDGMQITSIEKNSILLEKDGMKYKIDYTR